MSSIGDWIGNNKDWLAPVIKTGLGYLGQRNNNNTQSQYLDYLREREMANYQNSVDEINYYNAQGAANAGAYNSAASAAAAAQAATEANRIAASGAANSALQKNYKQILKMYAPYKKVADTLLPQMSQTYQNSLGLQNALSSYVNSPAQVAKLDASGPAWNVNVPLPDSVRLR
jgi:hypothetical protein